MKGIDVSTYQGYPDWERVAADGVAFAMIKTSQGRAESSDSYMFTDSKFKYNITNATAAGIPCGVYHYFTAQTEAECDREVDYFLYQLKPHRDKITLWAAIDVESKYLTNLSRDKLTALVKRFCDAVAADGYKPIVYTNPDWMRNRLGQIDEYDLWLALWRSKLLVPSGYNRMRIWQWGTSNVDGISGKVDTNIGYFELPKADEPKEEVIASPPIVESCREKFRAGDAVRIETPILYDTGKRFLTKFMIYTIDSIDGDRVTVSHYGQWRVAVHIDNIEKV